MVGRGEKPKLWVSHTIWTHENGVAYTFICKLQHLRRGPFYGSNIAYVSIIYVFIFYILHIYMNTIWVDCLDSVNFTHIYLTNWNKLYHKSVFMTLMLVDLILFAFHRKMVVLTFPFIQQGNNFNGLPFWDLINHTINSKV